MDLRCEHCGKLVTAPENQAPPVRCPNCRRRLSRPEALAALPRPLVPPAMPGATPVAAMPAVPPPPPAEPESEADRGAMDKLARAMPWAISAMLHAGVLMILAFLTIVMLRTNPKQDVIPPDFTTIGTPPGPAKDPDKDPRPGPKDAPKDPLAEALKQLTQAKPRDLPMLPSIIAETKRPIPIIGLANPSAEGSGPNSQDGIVLFMRAGPGGNGSGPGNDDGGGGGTGGRRPSQVVYVVDASGSMLEPFDLVKRELLTSVSRLADKQSFHVIFFNNGQPRENTPRQLVAADEHNKRQLLGYLRNVSASGGSPTDPTMAIERAFATLQRGPKGGGKLIFLLTDGEFHDNQAVRNQIRQLNRDQGVQVVTMILGFRNPDFEQVMRQIAQENRGQYKFVDFNR